MKIAIHHSHISFSREWIKYCDINKIKYKIVDCYASDIIQKLSDCDALMWHFYQANPKDSIFAKQLLYSVQSSGKKVFPDFYSSWHFDDKVGQKYLFESIGAPLVPSYVFYSQAEANKWANQTEFPKVFKLSRGSSSANVRLVSDKKQAIRLINKAFKSGFRLYNPWIGLKERLRKYKMGQTTFIDIMKGIGRFFIKTNFEKMTGKDKGYIYFQDFVDGCKFDIRVKVIGNKCWAFKRLVRENDFRASGSDLHLYSHEDIPLEVIKNAFAIAKRLKLQCVAFDYILTKNNTPLLIEMSFGFGYTEDQFYGYWDSEMNRHNEKFNPFGWMVDDLLKSIKVQENNSYEREIV